MKSARTIFGDIDVWNPLWVILWISYSKFKIVLNNEIVKAASIMMELPNWWVHSLEEEA